MGSRKSYTTSFSKAQASGVLRAISELEKAGLLKDVKRLGGTSAGAITALLLALDYSADEIAAIVGSTSFRKFNDGQFFFFGGFVRLRKHFGWYRGKGFEGWLAALET